ncbi:MAG: S26 family signal peptidase [Burkholderiales bacterium]
MPFSLTILPGRWDRLLVPLIILVDLTASVAALGYVGVRVNWTCSEPLGVYWIRPIAAPLRVGQMIEFCPPVRRYSFMLQGGCPGGSDPFFKEIVGVPGYWVTVTASGVTINGLMLPGSRPRRHARSDPSIALPVLRGTFRLGPGQYWTYGSGLPAESFDSRYWGPVGIGAVRGVSG